jgi:hypothetical protein
VSAPVRQRPRVVQPDVLERVDAEAASAPRPSSAQQGRQQPAREDGSGSVAVLRVLVEPVARDRDRLTATRPRCSTRWHVSRTTASSRPTASSISTETMRSKSPATSLVAEADRRGRRGRRPPRGRAPAVLPSDTVMAVTSAPYRAPATARTPHPQPISSTRSPGRRPPHPPGGECSACACPGPAGRRTRPMSKSSTRREQREEPAQVVVRRMLRRLPARVLASRGGRSLPGSPRAERRVERSTAGCGGRDR